MWFVRLPHIRRTERPFEKLVRWHRLVLPGLRDAKLVFRLRTIDRRKDFDRALAGSVYPIGLRTSFMSVVSHIGTETDAD